MHKHAYRLTVLSIAGLLVGIGFPTAHAATQAVLHDQVGTSIYSPGPLIPMQPFKLNLNMTHPSMQIIKMDVKKMHMMTCTLVPANTNTDTAILSCRPGK
ncbi:hypothetical protein SAMN05421828_1458 [Acidiphilium rubrum]|uniref:Uncharacterized protein n=1 Tax=Acidiphilium rubrum TaxID=526 RepID=A0A8G2CNY0_ACIRU|nr:hypothetical protein SAMN05421828_1458 [Acidiphilium rubrum]